VTLRARLLVGLCAITVVLVLSGIGIAVSQQRHLYQQIDAQLEAFARTATEASLRSDMVLPAADEPLSTVNAYVGVFAPDGSLLTLVQPSDDPDLVPAVDSDTPLDQPTTIDTGTGRADRVRALAFDVEDRRVLVAVPTTDADESLQTLVIAQIAAGLVILFVLGLFAWWMIHHGLRPIRRMTESADAIAAGEVDRRVDQPPGRTEAARLGHALNLMIETTHEAEAQRRRFVADVSHELRTPLTTLQGYTTLYQQGSLPDRAALDDAMRRISDEAGRMKRIVDQLLVLSRLDEQQPLDIGEVDVVRVLTDLAADVRAIQPEREVVVDAAEGETVLADRDQVVQALTALTANALRYTPIDTPLDFRAVCVLHGVRLEVRDHGPGIPDVDKDHLFERFYRADHSRARSTGGSGLGLSIVSAIAAAHHGTCGVDDTPGGGATFWIHLPFAE
jgi:two-component system, OmpR family, sensor kinase